MAKKVVTIIKLHIPGSQATPAPPVGPALGQHGVNIMEFCKAFNEQTKDKMGTIIPVEVTVYEDRSFTFITKTPPATILIKEAVGLEKGSGEPHKIKVGTISRDKIKEIAQLKMTDLNAPDIEAAIRIIEGTARSMGVEIGEETAVNPEAIAQMEELRKKAEAEKAAQEAAKAAAAAEAGEEVAEAAPSEGEKPAPTETEGAAPGETEEGKG